VSEELEEEEEEEEREQRRISKLPIVEPLAGKLAYRVTMRMGRCQRLTLLKVFSLALLPHSNTSTMLRLDITSQAPLLRRWDLVGGAMRWDIPQGPEMQQRLYLSSPLV
jgi:hypothetical protein